MHPITVVTEKDGRQVVNKTRIQTVCWTVHHQPVMLSQHHHRPCRPTADPTTEDLVGLTLFLLNRGPKPTHHHRPLATMSIARCWCRSAYMYPSLNPNPRIPTVFRRRLREPGVTTFMSTNKENTNADIAAITNDTTCVVFDGRDTICYFFVIFVREHAHH